MEEISEHKFSVIYCRPCPDSEDNFQFAFLSIDIDDDWLANRSEEILQFAGLSSRAESPLDYALAALDYFGPAEFGAYSNYAFDWQNCSKAEICEIMRGVEGIPKEIREQFN